VFTQRRPNLEELPMCWHIIDVKGGIFCIFFFMYDIQHCFICRPSDSTVSEDAGLKPRTVATTALAVRRSNHSARSHPQSARSHPHSARTHPHLARSIHLSARSHPHNGCTTGLILAMVFLLTKCRPHTYSSKWFLFSAC
jgi:hypothetical protein